MKKGIILIALALLGLANLTVAQQGIPQYFDSVYVAGSEKTVVPVLSNGYDGIRNLEGSVVGFIFSVTNYVDTLTVAIFEGGYALQSGVVQYTAIDTLTELSNTTPYKFYQTPAIYQYYRLRLPLVSGDTATLKNVIYFEKYKTLK